MHHLAIVITNEPSMTPREKFARFREIYGDGWEIKTQNDMPRWRGKLNEADAILWEMLAQKDIDWREVSRYANALRKPLLATPTPRR